MPDPITIIAAATALARATGLGDLLESKLKGTKAAEVAGKVLGIARAVTGVADPSAAAVMLETNPELHQAYRMRLIELYEAEVMAEAADRASARAREVQIVTSEAAPMFVKLVPSILAVGVVALSFVVFLTMIFADVDAANKDVVVYVMGALNTAVTMILSYHFGSTKGSDSKNSAIEAMARKV